MIHALLEASLRQLQGDLGDVVKPLSWRLGPIAADISPPWVALYGGAIALAPAPKSLDPTVAVSDFQQEFWVAIASPTAQTLEQLTSLIVASLSLRQSALVERFNQSSGPGGHTYSTAQVATRHRLRQIQFVGAAPDYGGDRVRSQLQFRAIGQLEMRLLTSEPGTLLKTVVTTGQLAQAPHRWANVDHTTQWETTVDASTAQKGAGDGG
ncbi:hypothetical protein PGN35_004020 [Nodosilinea sp. PGN35]|uniref:hypothetical protein n=1 Tax=Nodosilinea sp. PGN35 TaxID=3020489 RepID=UPI0023B2B82C|nr:hypothetical protein [Nodosilinea sp. TSF1-S3]MDF0365786.1 hypothetical protein [Nodosilinea sp. TSF1-S3]